MLYNNDAPCNGGKLRKRMSGQIVENTRCMPKRDGGGMFGSAPTAAAFRPDSLETEPWLVTITAAADRGFDSSVLSTSVSFVRNLLLTEINACWLAAAFARAAESSSLHGRSSGTVFDG